MSGRPRNFDPKLRNTQNLSPSRLFNHGIMMRANCCVVALVTASEAATAKFDVIKNTKLVR
jgi:hypothetical protein